MITVLKWLSFPKVLKQYNELDRLPYRKYKDVKECKIENTSRGKPLASTAYVQEYLLKL